MKNNKFDFSWVEKIKIDPDLNRLEFQLAVFHPADNKFLKIANIDYRNYRFEVWEERKTRWLGFNQAFVFNYTDEEIFDSLYELYKNHPNRIRYRTKEKLLKWFQESSSRISFMSKEPEELDKGMYNGFYEKE